MSALAIYTALTKRGGSVYVIASDVKQASIVFNEAANMLELGELKNHLGNGKGKIRIRRSNKKIEYTDKDGFRSTIDVLSSTPEGKSGWSADLIIYDEIAEWNATSARTIWDRLKNATAAKQGLRIVISTPQFDREHLGFERYTYAKKVLTGEVIDTTFLPIIYEIPEDAKCICGNQCGDGWKCPEWWWKANPAAGFSVPRQDYFDDFKTVLNNPREEARWRTLRCGQWVGHSDQWLSHVAWGSCYEDFDEADFYNTGEPCFVGIDGSSRGDLFAITYCIRRNGKYYLIPRAFSPRDLAKKKEETDRVPYRSWETEGYITLTSGDVIDPRAVLNCLIEDSQRFDFVDIRYDPNGLELFRQAAEEEDLFLVEASQTPSVMAPPTAYLERLVKDRKIRHNGHPVLSWCIGNCTIKTDQQDRLMIDKRRVTGRIDLATSTILSLIGVMADEGDGDSDDPLCFLLGN